MSNMKVSVTLPASQQKTGIKTASSGAAQVFKFSDLISLSFNFLSFSLYINTIKYVD